MPIVTRTVNGVNQGINSFDLDQHTGVVNEISTESTFVSFLQSSTRFIEQIAENYSSLRDGLKDGGLAYVEASEGTSWLPYTLGGTYYPKGWYVWDGAQWITSKSNVAETLDALEGAGGGSSFSGDYNDLINKPTIPTDTVLSDADIAALGYIKTFTNTQLSDADITALGYVKTDNDTQLSDADITALGYVKSSGTDISFFQVNDDGATGQLVTNGYQNAAGFWDTPTLTNSDFTFDNTLGHLTVNTAGTIEIDAKLVTWQDENNRHELYIELQKNGVTLIADAQYASRNLNQRVGGAYLMGFKTSVSSGDILKLRTKRVGVAATIGINTAANMSYFSAKLYN